MEKLLQQFRDFALANPSRAFFGKPATPKALATIEKAIGAPLPPAYRAFLSAFDGGFINVSGGNPKDKDWDLGDARWNGNHFLTTKEVLEEYKMWAKIGADVFGFEGCWPYIPFCRTEGQELLVLDTTGKKAANPPILDAFHEMPPEEWRVLSPGLEKFLRAYLSKNGAIETIA